MEHQYPVAITGDENMLAELMLPDQAHARNQDWTIFFLHKDTSQEEEDEERKVKENRKQRRRRRRDRAAGIIDEEDEENEEDLPEDEWEDDDEDDTESTDSEPEGGEGPPLIYVLNLVNTKHDKSVKRGAIVKAMAICTRHPFLHIYKASSLDPRTILVLVHLLTVSIATVTIGSGRILQSTCSRDIGHAIRFSKRHGFVSHA
jgi:hypothetical protein